MEGKVVEIILVEDNRCDAEMTIRTFKKNCLANDIIHINDGIKALAFFMSEDTCFSQKLVLLDLKMPKLDGMEVLQRLKSDSRTKTIPVIMIASSMDDPALEKCGQMGADGYIIKPVCFENFIKTTSQLGIGLQLNN